jgi:hypothetical protein
LLSVNGLSGWSIVCSVGDFVKPLSQPVSNRSCAEQNVASVTAKTAVASVTRKPMMHPMLRSSDQARKYVVVQEIPIALEVAQNPPPGVAFCL